MTIMRLYRALLRFYPASFRGEYGEEMAAIFRHRLRDADGPTRTRRRCGSPSRRNPHQCARRALGHPSPGPALHRTHAWARARLRPHRHRHRGARRRGQHGRVFGDRLRPLQAAALQGRRSPRHDLAADAGHSPGWSWRRPTSGTGNRPRPPSSTSASTRTTRRASSAPREPDRVDGVDDQLQPVSDPRRARRAGTHLLRGGRHRARTEDRDPQRQPVARRRSARIRASWAGRSCWTRSRTR